jgi:hypothetical protein
MNASEIDKFLQDGWVILDIPQAEVLRSYAKKLETKLDEQLALSKKPTASVKEPAKPTSVKQLGGIIPGK